MLTKTKWICVFWEVGGKHEAPLATLYILSIHHCIKFDFVSRKDMDIGPHQMYFVSYRLVKTAPFTMLCMIHLVNFNNHVIYKAEPRILKLRRCVLISNISSTCFNDCIEFRVVQKKSCHKLRNSRRGWLSPSGRRNYRQQVSSCPHREKTAPPIDKKTAPLQFKTHN